MKRMCRWFDVLMNGLAYLGNKGVCGQVAGSMYDERILQQGLQSGYSQTGK